MSDHEPEILTVAQTSALLGIERHTVYRLVHAGVIPAVKLSPRTWRIPRALLMQRLEAIALSLEG